MLSAAALAPLLAGTQCTQCGYPSCAAYAEALLVGVPTNLCRPGGESAAVALASALNQPYAPPAETPLPPEIAYVNEPDCIGCTLCLQKCPTSAIVGAPKQLHTILTNLCDGCSLCVPVCPTQCITLQPAPPKHALTQALPNGSLTQQASSQIWALVHATESRQSAQSRPTKSITQTMPANLSAISPEVLAKIAAARQKSQDKFAAKGPIRTPRALRKPKK